MLGTIVIRTLLVVALICMAHSIKPFSVKNVARHLLYSTRSFAFILPEQTRASFDNASYLALNLSDSLFPENQEDWNGNADEGLMLAAQTSQNAPRPALKVWPPDEPAKPARKPKPGPKRSAPSKRIDRGDSNENTIVAAVAPDNLNSNLSPDLFGETIAEDAELVIAMPVSLPVISPALSEEVSRLHTLSMGFLFSTEAAEKLGCPEQEWKLLKLAAGIEVLKKPRVILQRAEKPRTSAPECEGEKPDGSEPEVIAPPEAVEAPEQPEPESHEAEEAPAEQPPTPPMPLKCPVEPEV